MSQHKWPFELKGTVDPSPEGVDNPRLSIEPCADDKTCTVVELDGFETLCRHVRVTELVDMMRALERRRKELLG